MCPHSQSLLTESAEEQFTSFVAAAACPSVGAKSALNKGRMRFAQFGALGEAAHAPAICARLNAFSREFPEPGNTPTSFVAMFTAAPRDEAGFERLLWRQLQLVHDVDRAGASWDASVGCDPSQDDFSMSIGGRAYFVVGLHPGASRFARRAPFPCLVFNFHDQFEALKASGKYQTMQTAIRARDIALQGSVNPVLARFGEASEARQYSGRQVPEDWKCPFHARRAEAAHE